MPELSLLTLSDLHGRKSDISWVGAVDIIALLGDLVDEYMPYSQRISYLREFSKEIKRLKPETVFIVPGNHENMCEHYERVYSNLDNSDISKARAECETRYERAISAIDIPPVTSTMEALEELGVISDYICVGENGVGEPGDIGRYNLYVSGSVRIPKNIRSHSELDKAYLLSHHKSLGTFKNEKAYTTYIHGHRHDFYEDGGSISLNVVRGKKVYRFRYYLDVGEIRPNGKCETPGVSFVVRGSKKKDKLSRVAGAPGIFGDQMLWDGGTVTYKSAITGRKHSLDLDELYHGVSEKIKDFDLSRFPLLI